MKSSKLLASLLMISFFSGAVFSSIANSSENAQRNFRCQNQDNQEYIEIDSGSWSPKIIAYRYKMVRGRQRHITNYVVKAFNGGRLFKSNSGTFQLQLIPPYGGINARAIIDGIPANKIVCYIRNRS